MGDGGITRCRDRGGTVQHGSAQGSNLCGGILDRIGHGASLAGGDQTLQRCGFSSVGGSTRRGDGSHRVVGTQCQRDKSRGSVGNRRDHGVARIGCTQDSGRLCGSQTAGADGDVGCTGQRGIGSDQNACSCKVRRSIRDAVDRVHGSRRRTGNGDSLRCIGCGGCRNRSGASEDGTATSQGRSGIRQAVVHRGVAIQEQGPDVARRCHRDGCVGHRDIGSRAHETAIGVDIRQNIVGFRDAIDTAGRREAVDVGDFGLQLCNAANDHVVAADLERCGQ